MSWTTSLFAMSDRTLLDTAGRRALLLDLRAKLGYLAREGPLVHEVRFRVRPDELRQITSVGLQLTGLPIKREHQHSAVLGALERHRSVSNDQIERQLHSKSLAEPQADCSGDPPKVGPVAHSDSAPPGMHCQRNSQQSLEGIPSRGGNNPCPPLRESFA